ncbi:50S ribosomal protein L11 methyltransferase [Calditerricola yamamurae]
MTWIEIAVHTTHEAQEAVANLLHEAGAGGVVIEDPLVLLREGDQAFGEIYALDPAEYPKEGVVVKAYLPSSPHLPETVKAIEAAVRGLAQYGIEPGPARVTLAEVDEANWSAAWKKYYKPIRVTPRLTIRPVWESYTPEHPEERVIALDPGMAFGTGTHPTTVLCLRALEQAVRPGDTVIDVGCGSGVLAIAAAKLGAGEVLALDLDPVAVRAARQNVALNKLEDHITVRENNLLDGVTVAADVIVANILAEVIVRLAGDAAAHLKPGGTFIASGIIRSKAPAVREAMESSGLAVVETVSEDDWLAVIAKK